MPVMHPGASLKYKSQRPQVTHAGGLLPSQEGQRSDTSQIATSNPPSPLTAILRSRASAKAALSTTELGRHVRVRPKKTLWAPQSNQQLDQSPKHNRRESRQTSAPQNHPPCATPVCVRTSQRNRAVRHPPRQRSSAHSWKHNTPQRREHAGSNTTSPQRPPQQPLHPWPQPLHSSYAYLDYCAAFEKAIPVLRQVRGVAGGVRR